MNNPWEYISLEIYEDHMSLESVRQLQALDSVMHDQFDAYPVTTAMVLGIAGGNGLEHVRRDKYQALYGVDINEDYLEAIRKRYDHLSDILKCLRIDLVNETEKLPKAEMIIADLLIEYIGYDAFCKAVEKVDPEYVSCVIQTNEDDKKWVSDSPYIHAFDRLDEIHHQIDESSLVTVMEGIGYSKILRKEMPLPNGKSFIRLDFSKK